MTPLTHNLTHQQQVFLTEEADWFCEDIEDWHNKPWLATALASNISRGTKLDKAEVKAFILTLFNRSTTCNTPS